MDRPLTLLRLVSIAPGAHTARLVAPGLSLACALGAGGRRMRKREGDGATPSGAWRLRAGRYRADRLMRVRSGLALAVLKPGDGWCDAPRDPHYNRPVPLPYKASAETLMRADRLYDVVVMMGYNDRPVRPGAGSAIFLHIAKDGCPPTEGCIAISPADMRKLLPRLSPRTRIVVP